jgi:Coenzyme PQQ synthesis protein D (PqqD)
MDSTEGESSEDSRVIGPPRRSVRALELDGDISLYDAETCRAVVLNSTASDVWRLLDGEHSMTEVVRLLASAYSVEPEAIQPDVERTVAALAEAGFLAG